MIIHNILNRWRVPNHFTDLEHSIDISPEILAEFSRCVSYKQLAERVHKTVCLITYPDYLGLLIEFSLDGDSNTKRSLLVTHSSFTYIVNSQFFT